MRTWYKIPKFIPLLYPKRIWNIGTDEKELYLTFDDGPTEHISSRIVDILKEYEAKASFFCVGENISKYPAQYRELHEAGHTTGNHTYNHLNGWKTPLNIYLDNVKLCSEAVESKFFRPPYGKMNSRQADALLSEGYKIIMWSYLSYDFDSHADKRKVWEKMRQDLFSGDIVVFHDHAKAKDNMEYLLRHTLEHFSAQGYTFKAL